MAEEFPSSPEGMVERSDEFLDIAEKPENAGKFNLSAAQVADWRGQTNVVLGLLDQRHALEEQLRGVNAQIKVEAPKLETVARGGLGTAARSTASNELKAEAGVTIPKPRVDAAPITPTRLVATPNANGTVDLDWDRTGNIRSAKFRVFKRAGDAWNLQTVVTAVKVTLPAKVGERAAFHVEAQNGRGISLPSQEAVIYDS